MQKKTYYTVLVLATLSPLLTYFITTLLSDSGEVEGLGNGLLAIVGVPFVGVTGLVTSSILELLKTKNQKLMLSGYVVPAILVSLLLAL